MDLGGLGLGDCIRGVGGLMEGNGMCWRRLFRSNNKSVGLYMQYLDDVVAQGVVRA